jgi:hypothetical protein
MLTGSAITRALIIVVLAAGLAGLWQLLMPRATGPYVSEPPKRADAGRSGQTAPAGESDDQVRSVYPGPRPAEPPQRPPQMAETAPAPSPVPVPGPTPVPMPSPPPVFTPPVPSAPLPPDETSAEPAVEPPPAAAGAVDLNTASLAELNGLRGGGMIGKAIIARRPYASPSDLLSKRVLSRSTYERIKDQITVR